MKKVLSLLLASLMLAACSPKTANEEATTTPEATTETSTETTAEATGFKVGVASVTNIKASDATADKDGQIQGNTTIAALATKDGVITYLKLDVAQNTAKFDTTGAFTSDKDAATPTKLEKGADYGMAAASGISKEWFEQIASFEEYAIGKTVEEVLATPTYEKDENHKAVPESEDLKSSVTIDISSYLAAIEKANENSVAVENVASIGTSSSTKVSYTDLSEDKDGKVQFNTAYAVVAQDADGKIVYTNLDVAQNAGTFDKAGVITSDSAAATPTKLEKGADYGMAAASGIGKEWFEQANAFGEYTLGKTVEEVLATPTFEKDENHKAVPESEDLKSSVTIDISAFLTVIEKANENKVEVK